MKNGKYTGKQLYDPLIKYVWFKDDQWHRLDGPAIEYWNGHKEWFYHGEQINCQSQEEFERIIKLISFK